MAQRTARDATDTELLDVLAQVPAYLQARDGVADPTDAIVIAAVIEEARLRGLIGPEPFL